MRVLLVDDREVAEYVRRELEEESFSVVVAHDGGSGLRLAETAAFDIIVLDVMMPFLDGLQVTRALRRQNILTPISQHESACEQINRMLCERTACERFATLFWGVFDPAASTLRYVNAGHAAPMLFRKGRNRIDRLDEGGPVLGLLPGAQYSAGTVEVKASDLLILYSDGIDEATDQNNQEFGEDRIKKLAWDPEDATPSEVCERIINQVTAFASTGVPPDDRTLLVVRFPQAGAVPQHRNSGEIRIGAVA